MKKVLDAPNTDKLLLLMHKNFQFLATTVTTQQQQQLQQQQQQQRIKLSWF